MIFHRAVECRGYGTLHFKASISLNEGCLVKSLIRPSAVSLGDLWPVGSRNGENDIYKLVASHLRRFYPDVPFHFDLSGVNNTSRYSRGLYKQLNGASGYPDLFIATPAHTAFGDFSGLFIEIKQADVRIRRKDGELVADEHIRAQADWHKRLNRQGYYAAFCTGYESCVELIDTYLTGTYNQEQTF